jgi:hypothetical protein
MAGPSCAISRGEVTVSLADEASGVSLLGLPKLLSDIAGTFKFLTSPSIMNGNRCANRFVLADGDSVTAVPSSSGRDTAYSERCKWTLTEELL